jgi:hypothetical protein
MSGELEVRRVIACPPYTPAMALPGVVRRLCQCGTAIACVPSNNALISSGAWEGLCPDCLEARLQEAWAVICAPPTPLAQAEFEAIVQRRN